MAEEWVVEGEVEYRKEISSGNGRGGGVVVDDKVLKGNHGDEEGQSPSSNS